ncbi:hypothetical protein CPB86DRAFT_781775 [Serendipita vermifera]|nr:hypothetical protein CPB86DRAFT_781775 [Serendipita vermifera]
MTSISRQTRIPFGTSFTNLPTTQPSTSLVQNSSKQDHCQKANTKNRKTASKVRESCSADDSARLLPQPEKVPSQQAVIALPTIIEEKENLPNDYHKASVADTSSNYVFTPHWHGSTTKSPQRAITLSSDEIIYSTSSSYSSSPSCSSGSSAFSVNSDTSLGHVFCGPPLDELTIVPLPGLTEMEEKDMIEAYDISQSLEDDGDADDEGDLDAILGRGVLVPAPVFLAEPSLRSNDDLNPIKLTKVAEEDEEVQCTEIVESPHTTVKSLSARSREAQLARIYETRPLTPSLLSFTDDTPTAIKRRVHPKRMWQARYGPIESDALRKESCERRRLLRSGLRFLPAFPPLSNEQNILLFPRAGSLHQLHSPDSNGSLEDYALGYVDFSFIRKSLYAFDLRMRTGTDLWSDDEVDMHQLFGDNRQWEMDWNIRWRVAYWLLQDEDEDEEYDEDEERPDN